jgi:replicative DNA helicase
VIPTPAHVDAERALLGAVLVDPGLVASVSLRPGQLELSEHRAILQAIQSLDEAGREADAISVKAELERAGDLRALPGGAEYLGRLVSGTPRVSSVEGWEATIRQRSNARIVLAAGERMTAMIRQGDSAHDALEEGQRIIGDASAAVGGAVDLDARAQIRAAVRDIELATTPGSRTTRGWRTGLPALDSRLGLLTPGRFVIVAARTGAGKSTLLQLLGDSIAAQGGPVLLFSGEMTCLEWNRRRLSAGSGVPSSHFEPGGVTPLDRDWSRIAAAASKLSALPFYIEATTPTPLEARAKARFVKARVGLAALMFDYLQLFPPGPGRKGETREAEVARVSRAMKRMAMDLDVVVIAACQLNRNLEQRKDGRPRLSDLRESGSLEQDADVVVMLHRADDDHDGIEAIVAKHRNRATGVARLQFRGEFHRFEERTDA